MSFLPSQFIAPSSVIQTAKAFYRAKSDQVAAFNLVKSKEDVYASNSESKWRLSTVTPKLDLPLSTLSCVTLPEEPYVQHEMDDAILAV